MIRLVFQECGMGRAAAYDLNSKIRNIHKTGGTMAKERIVIIGGVAAGPKTAARVKRLNPDAEITIIEKGEYISYAGCGLPFHISGQVEDYKELMTTPVGVVRDPNFFRMVKDVTVLTGTLAESVDREKKMVKTVRPATGEKGELPYDTLVLAVGARPFMPPIKGIDLAGVFSLTTVDDARRIIEREGGLSGKKAVIIGGGLIGLEAAEALVRKDVSVTLVEKMDRVLPALIDPEIAHHLHGELRNKGVELILGDTVLSINDDGEGRVTSVGTVAGTHEADLVIVAIGSRPNTDLAEGMGLALGETGAIRVDGNMKTSDPHIYAGGDCVENRSLVTGKAVYTPMGSTANKHGRVIGDNICGKGTEYKGVLGSAIVRVFDQDAARTGLSEQEAKALGYDYITVLTPAPDKPHFLPDARLIIIKLVVDRKTRKILGAQIIGQGDVAKRIDIVITAMMHGATVDDMAQYDLAYAPPFSPAMDNIIVAANIAQNILDGIGVSISPMAVREKMEKGDDFILLDVRSPAEFEAMRIEDKRVKLLPLGKLRSSLAELPRDKEVVAFCKISLRGYEAQRILGGEGYDNVKFMDGGLLSWPYEKVS